MSAKSQIEWTDATWNPVLGCDKISPGCKNCYAIRTARRLQHNPNPKVAKAYEGLTKIEGGQPNWTGRVNFVPDRLDQPLRWREPRMIFVNSESDLFHDGVSDDQLDQMFAVMANAYWHTFQVLTKRPERAKVYLNDSLREAALISYRRRFQAVAARIKCGFISRWPPPNVWLGVSAENQATADERIPLLLQTPAAVRWVSGEPLLGPIDFAKPFAGCPGDILTGIYGSKKEGGPYCTDRFVRWVVVGGESGPGARPMHPDWARSIRDQCQAAGVPFFFKQWGSWEPSGYSGGKFDPAQAGQLIAGTVACSTNRKDIGKTVYHAIPLKADEGKETATWRVMNEVGKKAAGRLLDGKEWSEYPQVAEALTA